ncbi:MAG TPA: molybdate ABC transporter substrate-binding protein [Nitrospira sp.]|jgi:molybdate transport system substrate-binding protein|nr:molybdate ABC transporter substrate-binding protein [Nitrospira sp.]
MTTNKTNPVAFVFVLLLTVIAVLGWMPNRAVAQPETLTIAAANSLKDALRKLLPAFERQHPEVGVRIIYGPSQSLRKQIEEGAPVDVFLPSLSEEIDELAAKGLIIDGTKRIYAGTSLVVITGPVLPAPVRSIEDLHSIPVRRIAVGDPKTSSVGKVAAQFLKFSKLDPKLKSQYVYGEHSRAVLDLVSKGEAEIGVVYRTDAVTDRQVRILDTAPAESHSPIHYAVAIVWTARNITGAGDFIEFLLSSGTQDELKKYGFDRAGEKIGLLRRQEVTP